MMKQNDLFGQEITPQVSTKYTSKIKAPIYEPKNRKPYIEELYNHIKTERLISEINSANISEEEKRFLIHAARRHTIFNYSKIADYYAHSSIEMQQLMEQSALVIIDFEKAVEYGYVRLNNELTNLFLEEKNEQ